MREVHGIAVFSLNDYTDLNCMDTEINVFLDFFSYGVKQVNQSVIKDNLIITITYISRYEDDFIKTDPATSQG